MPIASTISFTFTRRSCRCIAVLFGQGQLSLTFNFAHVVHCETVPFVLPRPGLSVRPYHRLAQCNVVNESFNLGLHAPVFELYTAQFVGAHNGLTAWSAQGQCLATTFARVICQPRIVQWPPACFITHVDARVFFA